MVADVGIVQGSQPWLRLARTAKILALLTLVWLGIEGGITAAPREYATIDGVTH
jgi:hypothetical protein